jgi:hypothetical protein
LMKQQKGCGNPEGGDYHDEPDQASQPAIERSQFGANVGNY